MNPVLESAEAVARQSRFVSIHGPAVARVAEHWSAAGVSVPGWDRRHHYHDGGLSTVAYLLVLDSLNFCFWAPPGRDRWEITWKGETLSGYIALAAALKRAVERDASLLTAHHLSHISSEELREILRGRGALQLMEERLAILHELGRRLLSDFGGHAHRLVASARHSALALVTLLQEKLPSFRDTAWYRGRKVFFYKRAQILAADLSGAFDGEGWGRFHDLDRLTAFPDYKLPQVLRQLGILRYAPDLARRVDGRVLLEPGSPEEVEIRANTVWAVELLRRHGQRQGSRLRAHEIDGMLWHLGQQPSYRKKPYHRTVTIFY